MSTGRVIQQKILGGTCSSKDKYYVAFSHMLLSHHYFKARLLEYFEFDVERAFNADKNDLNILAETYTGLSIPRNFIKDRDVLDVDKIYNETVESGIKFITASDVAYPQMLKGTSDFPVLLYYLGDLSRIDFNKTVAVVGSRTASESAKTAVTKIIGDLRGTECTIVSGLAYGIDTVAHKAAIDNRLKTVGVIASGFKHTYPASNKNLYKKIEDEAGVVFSEYPYAVPPISSHFPQRNRIVTGLSFGTIVGEAKIKSGAMISANLTLEQGRELMCVPGPITSPNCEGIYHLLKNGAHMVTSGADVLDALGWELLDACVKELELDDAQRLIYNSVSIEPRSIEALEIETQLGTIDLMVNLTQLELEGLIKQINGQYFIAG